MIVLVALFSPTYYSNNCILSALYPRTSLDVFFLARRCREVAAGVPAAATAEVRGVNADLMGMGTKEANKSRGMRIELEWSRVDVL